MQLLDFLKSTEFNKRIPKQKFYENISISPAVKRNIIDQIKVIYWRNKIATTTTNFAPGKNVTELEVFLIRLNFPYIDENILREIDKQIPYHILYLLEYEDKYQTWICYKEQTNAGSNSFKVDTYYHTEWMSEENVALRLDGLSLDDVYENLVRQIAGDQLVPSETNNLKESIEKSQQKEKIEKQIAMLQSKLQKEKQFNRKVEINSKIKELRREMSRING